jgi:hypothetical protein
MKNINLFILATSLIFIAGCSRYVAPPFTSVDKVVKVKTGMSMAEVSSTLGIEPYDAYFSQDDGFFVVTYNYRLKDRRMTIISPFPGEREKKVRSEEAQLTGEIWYQRSYQTIYVFFKDGKMKSLITDNGRADGEFLLITNNNISFINKNQLSSYGDKEIKVVPLGKEREEGGGGIKDLFKKGRNKSKKSN